jgi:5-methylcytosine-specific restriction endonuclease McrA
MARQPNTDRQGNSFPAGTIKKVWEKGQVIPDYSADIWRWDKCGQVMKFSEHGDRSSDTGWEIDHINPVSNNGSDDIDNLQPLNWKNNSNKSDKLNWTCPK